MKKNVLRKLIKVILVSALVLNFAVFNVYADNLDSLGMIIDGSKLTNEESSESVDVPLLRANYLNQGIAKITDLGGGKVNVYGSTTCHVTCDKVTLNLTLQRYSDGYWYNVKTYSASGTNTATVTDSQNVSVSKGYYYRVKGLCTAKKGSTTETRTPTTDGIWVG